LEFDLLKFVLQNFKMTFSCSYTRRFWSGGRICRDKFNFGYIWKANLYCLKWSGNTLFCGL